MPGARSALNTTEARRRGRHPRRAASGWLLAVVLALASASAAGQGWGDAFRDSTDGRFDLSEWLLDRKGFLPVPIVITEPAIGYGAGVAVAFFRETLRDAADRSRGAGHSIPPDIFAVAAFATENGTKGAGAGGQWTYHDDRYRYRGGIARITANLDFYGVGGGLPAELARLGYTLDGFASFQQGMLRLGAGDSFVGVRWIYLDLASRLSVQSDTIDLAPRQLAKRSSGLGVVLEHDSRDNIFTPNRGTMAAVEANFYEPDFGSSNRFQAYRMHVFDFVPLGRAWTLGLRADGRAARGDVPFYMLPFIDLRGVPMMRFQDRNTAVVEFELRWNLTDRWALIGFAGAGRAWGERDSFSGGEKPSSGGAGFRYLIARRMGIYAGVDYAVSSVDRAIYLQVGHAWR